MSDERGQVEFGGLIHELIGCTWGRNIGGIGKVENKPCHRQAVQIVVVHGPNGKKATCKLCAEHRDVVFSWTTPHEDGPGD